MVYCVNGQRLVFLMLVIKPQGLTLSQFHSHASEFQAIGFYRNTPHILLDDMFSIIPVPTS